MTYQQVIVVNVFTISLQRIFALLSEFETSIGVVYINFAQSLTELKVFCPMESTSISPYFGNVILK
ncbi:MAG: hypothetical protein ACNS60_14265 [Candidatus Cyclobacteriaceae bacterium M2_1C_046]